MLTEILLTLKLHQGEEVTTDKVSNKVPNKVPNKSELQVLALLKQNSRLTRTLLSDATGISESGIKKILASLKKYGLIKRIGSNKSGYWEVYN